MGGRVPVVLPRDYHAAVRALQLAEDPSPPPVKSQGGPDSAPVVSQSSTPPTKLAPGNHEPAWDTIRTTCSQSLDEIDTILDATLETLEGVQPQTTHQTELVAAVRSLRALRTQVDTTRDILRRSFSTL